MSTPRTVCDGLFCVFFSWGMLIAFRGWRLAYTVQLDERDRAILAKGLGTGCRLMAWVLALQIVRFVVNAFDLTGEPP